MKDFFKMFDFVNETNKKGSATSALSSNPSTKPVEDVLTEPTGSVDPTPSTNSSTEPTGSVDPTPSTNSSTEPTGNVLVEPKEVD